MIIGNVQKIWDIYYQDEDDIIKQIIKVYACKDLIYQRWCITGFTSDSNVYVRYLDQDGVVNYHRQYPVTPNKEFKIWLDTQKNFQFAGNYLKTLNFELVDTTNCTTMHAMFFNNTELTSINVSNFNTQNVVTMKEMFCGCNSLEEIDLSNFNVTNVTDMGEMFFADESLLYLDLKNFSTPKLTNVSSMFGYCEKLKTLDLSNFDISNVVDKQNMFKRCDSLIRIRCKQSFKDWCLANQDKIDLPDAMRSGGSGTWEIVD